MKKSLLLVLLFACMVAARAQGDFSSFNVLRISSSAHVAALGGENASLIEDAPAVGWNNPALFSNVSDRSVGLDFMTYPNGGKLMGAQFVKAFGERHTTAFMGQYMGYGSMDETDVVGNVLGSFSPKDIVLGVGYSYLLSDRWSGGATFKTVYSKYAEYSAAAISFDVGLNYYNEETDFSASAVLRNVGAQVKAFDVYKQDLPLDLQVGFTKGMAHAPVRISLTMTDLTHWDGDFYYHGDEKAPGFGTRLINHFVLGVDLLPTDYLYLSAGYNARRAYELKAADSGRLAGFSFGGGLNLARFKAGITYSRYHVSAGSLLFNVATSF